MTRWPSIVVVAFTLALVGCRDERAGSAPQRDVPNASDGSGSDAVDGGDSPDVPVVSDGSGSDVTEDALTDTTGDVLTDTTHDALTDPADDTQADASDSADAADDPLVDTTEDVFTFPDWGICTPAPRDDVDYCYRGRDGFVQREVRGGICEHFAPSDVFPPVCDEPGPIVPWDFVWLEGVTPELQVTCNLETGCPEVVRYATLATDDPDRKVRLGMSPALVLQTGDVLFRVAFNRETRTEPSPDPRGYHRLVAITPELTIGWQTPDYTFTYDVRSTPSGDILLAGSQNSTLRPATPAGERPSYFSSAFLTRLDQETGEPHWLAHLAAGPDLSGHRIRDGLFHGRVSAFCDHGRPPTNYRASAAITIDLETGDVASCAVRADTADEIHSVHLLNDLPVYQTKLVTLGAELPVQSIVRELSTLTEDGEAETLVEGITGDHHGPIRLADRSWLWPMAEWVRLDDDGNELSRTRPFGSPENEILYEALMPIIGYNDTTAITAGGSPLTLVSTRRLIEDGVVEVKYRYDFERVNTGYGAVTALQDGAWLASGSFAMYVVDGEGNVLWSAQSEDPYEVSTLFATVIDDEHIMIAANRPRRDADVPSDRVDLYVVRHVHGGVANSQHAMFGYDIHRSWIPPENPVVDGPEIEPRWTLAGEGE